MSQRIILLASMLFLTLEFSAQARLGETLDQLTDRYGPGANAGTPTATYPVSVRLFHKGGWSITVKLIDGISVGEKFQKQGTPSDEEISTLLSSNAQGQTWTEKSTSRMLVQIFLPVPSVSKSWQRDDGALALLTGPLPVCLELQSKQLIETDQAKEAADKKAKETSLQGF